MYIKEVDNKSGCGSVWLERCVRDAEAGGSNPLTPTIFLQKKWSTKTQVFTSLREAQLHSKGGAFSSHFHQTPEALLVKAFALLTCEDAHFIRL